MIEEIKPEVNISRTYKNGNIITKEEAEAFPGLNIKTFPAGARLATVTVGNRITKNLGNYESVQIYVEIALPTPIEEIQECYDAAQSLVEKKLMEQVDLVDQYKSSK